MIGQQQENHMTFTPDKNLNDSLDDLIGNVDVAKAANPVAPPDSYVPGTGRPNKYKDSTLYTEPCRKCRGSGHYYGPSQHGSRCFECDGVGSKTFKTSPEHRAKAKASTHARKAAKAADIATAKAEAATAFRAANVDLCTWIDAKAATFGFAASMQNAIATWGKLTDGQTEAVRKLIARDAERKVEAATRAAAAPAADTAGIDRLKLAFDTAIANAAEKGLKKNPKITIGDMVITPAKANSKNPGALYVTQNGGQDYLGKIAQGRFFASRECSPVQQTKILAFVADPAQAAKVYGQETGTCCICNATLTSEWKLRGIGPICAEKFGW